MLWSARLVVNFLPCANSLLTAVSGVHTTPRSTGPHGPVPSLTPPRQLTGPQTAQYNLVAWASRRPAFWASSEGIFNINMHTAQCGTCTIAPIYGNKWNLVELRLVRALLYPYHFFHFAPFQCSFSAERVQQICILWILTGQLGRIIEFMPAAEFPAIICHLSDFSNVTSNDRVAQRW